MSETAVPVAAYAGPRAYKLFNVRLLRKRPLSHCLWRFTFMGLDVRGMATAGPDQRIKLFFPGPDGQPPPLGAGAGEVDVAFVRHGEPAPPSRWAIHAHVGDPLQIMGPNAAFTGQFA